MNLSSRGCRLLLVLTFLFPVTTSAQTTPAQTKPARDTAARTTNASQASPERPNVLLILCDDIRWNALSCMEHPHLRTPNIDRLASEGLLFENTFCTTSLCSPGRASILSGLYAHGHGVVSNFTDYPAELDSFPGRLQKAGYSTAYIGKWHMGEQNDNPRPGFDHFVTHKGQGKYFDTVFIFRNPNTKMRLTMSKSTTRTPRFGSAENRIG